MKTLLICTALLWSSGAHAQSPTEMPRQSSADPEATKVQEGQPSPLTDAKVYKVGGSVKPPKLVHQEEARYSDDARKKKISGEVLIRCVVDLSGLPQDIEVVKSAGYGLDEQAVKAVQQYRFAPATKDGEPVKVTINVSVNFQIFGKHWWSPF